MVVRSGDSIEAVTKGFAEMGRMDDEARRNLELFRDAFAGIMVGDIDRYFDRFADDAVLCEPESLFYGGDHKGVAACKALGQRVLREIYERVDYEVLEIGASGDRVFAHLNLTFVFRETGEKLPMQVFEMWRFKDGMITECRPFIFDSHALAIRTAHLADKFAERWREEDLRKSA